MRTYSERLHGLRLYLERHEIEGQHAIEIRIQKASDVPKSNAPAGWLFTGRSLGALALMLKECEEEVTQNVPDRT